MKHRQPFHLFVSSCTLVAAWCCAMPARAIVNGIDTTSFSAVGALGNASGVLIADNWVLTAAHVGNALSPGSSSFTSLTGSSLVEAVYTFSSAAFPDNDIALVRLSTSLDIVAPLLNDQILSASQLGSLGSLTIATAQNQSPNGHATTTAYDTPTSYVENGTSYTVNWLLTGGPAYAQGGDSGGGLFLGAVSDSAGSLLLGITSASLINDDTGAVEGSAFVQVASYKGWIDNALASSGQQAMWASSVPEPSVWLLVMVGAGIIGARRTGHFSQNS